MKVQIYLTSLEDVTLCLDAGVDFIGVVADQKLRTPSSLVYSAVKNIFQQIPKEKMRVALTLDVELPTIMDMIHAVHPDVVHFGVEPEKISLDIYTELSKLAPAVKLMQAIPMNDNNPIETALAIQSQVDYLLLDTNDPDRIDLGATGQTHDWNLSAQLVKKLHIPVILAGGLSPENVKEAIRIVRPWGVDSFSHTNHAKDFRKDKEKVNVFVKHAKFAL